MKPGPDLSILLRRKLAKLWPDESERDEAIAALPRYGSEESEHAVERVHLAILKLAEGRLGAVPQWVEAAKGDFRDVLYWAENPEESRSGRGGVWMSHLAPAEAEKVKAMRERDRQQYEEWLEE